MSERGAAANPYWTARRVQASGGSILLAIATIVAVVLVRGLVVSASQPIGWVLAAATTALVLWPVVQRLDSWIPRGLGIVLALVLTATLAVGLFLAANSELRAQLASLERRLPAAAQALEERDGPGGTLDRLDLSTLVRDVVEKTSERVAPEPTVEDAAGTAPAFLVSGILVIFFLVWGPRMLAGGLRQITDDQTRARVAAVAGRAASRTQGYVLATAATGVLAGLAVGLLAWWVGLPTPLVLGVVVGVASVVPYLGVLFGSVPMLLLAAPTEPGVVVALLVVAVVAVQAAHTAALTAWVRRGLLRAGPAVLVVGAMVGSDAYGLGGALVAVIVGVFAVAAIDAVAATRWPDGEPASTPTAAAPA